jgi:hypothetical protein
MKSGVSFKVLNCDKRKLDAGAHYYVDAFENVIFFDEDKDEYLAEHSENTQYIFDSKDINRTFTLDIEHVFGDWWCNIWY